jgi:hypothetical protein
VSEPKVVWLVNVTNPAALAVAQKLSAAKPNEIIPLTPAEISAFHNDVRREVIE